MLEGPAGLPRRGLAIKAISLSSVLLLAGVLAFVATRSVAGPAQIDAEPALIEAAAMDTDAILKHHNIYRCMHGVSPLTWDSGVASSAQRTVDRIGYDHGDTANGENLAWASNGFNIGMVDGWYNEIEYTPNREGKVTSSSRSTGHYTQVVWAGSSKLGCGVKDNTLNCQYSPAGNVGGQFSSNVPKVEKSWDECEGGSGDACDFPTEYKGQSYAGCTTEGHTEAWCYKKSGGYRGCNAGDNACEFPFEYKDTTYTSCTSKDHDSPWCYKVGGGYKTC